MHTKKISSQSTRLNRPESIRASAIEVFLRYGFKKTSMDDLAKAAGISRQGLYLHYQNKELLFDAALKHLVKQILSSAKAMAEEHDLDLQDRLLGIFNSLHRGTLNPGSVDNRSEVIQMARLNSADLVAKLEKEFVGIVERLLNESAVADYWASEKISTRQLAEHCFWVSSGAAQEASPAEYDKRMRVAVKVVFSPSAMKHLTTTKSLGKIGSK